MPCCRSRKSHSELNIIDVLEPGDRVGIFYNFMPASQFTWPATYRDTIQKVKAGKPVERNKVGATYLFKAAISEVTQLSADVGAVAGSDRRQSSTERDASLIEAALSRVNRESRISEATLAKGHHPIIATQILVLSESSDRLRQLNNARSLVQTFDAITEDNSLAGKGYHKPVDSLKYSLGAEVNKVSSEEAQHFLTLPGRELLEQYKFISRVETQETLIPEELRIGVMCVGENTFRGASRAAYLSEDAEYKYLTLVIIGPTRAGKSTLIGNLSRDAINDGECVIMFDFIKNCDLSQEVAALFPVGKVLNIECSNANLLQGIGYNEVRPSKDVFTQYSNAKLQTTQLMALVNSINSEASVLSPKMERFLSSASLIAFINGGSVLDVFRILLDHRARHEFIRRVPEAQHENLEEYAESLLELDEYEEKTGNLIGTKTNLIIGVIDRLQKLKANPYMEMMLKRSTAGNVDLVAEMQRNQLITLKMPESMFSTDAERDIYCTYWISKIWLALQIRAQVIPDRVKHIKVNLVIDELYQVQNTQRFLTEKLSRLAKFSVKPILSCHYLNQIRIIREELRSANTSYMLVSGCDTKNFQELKSELYPFTEEDLLHLPRYHSLNMIKYSQGYANFVTRLPRPVSKAQPREAIKEVMPTEQPKQPKEIKITVGRG